MFGSILILPFRPLKSSRLRAQRKTAPAPWWVFGILLVGSLALANPQRIVGQEVDAAIVTGTVVDASQAAIPNADIQLTHIATNTIVRVQTNNRGEYRTPPLRLGTYEVSVEAPGFKRFDQKGVVLNIGDVRQVNVVLQVGEMTQSVTVEAAAPLLQRDDSTVGTVITNQEITELPLNGRDYVQLAALSSGTTSASGSGVTIGGEAPGQVAFLLDGQDNNNQQIGLHSSQKDIVEPSIDAIQEFKVVTNGYSAEYGRSSSGVVSVALKSGTNHFHGDGYEFVRNAALDAENYFVSPGTPKPPFGRNQFGGIIGGPIVHDKTFFFGDFEVGLIRQSVTSLDTLPTDAEREGEFSTPITNPSTGQLFPLVNGYYTIPSGSFDPIAAKVINLLPHAQLPVALNNYEYSSPNDTDTHRWDLRIDQILSDKQSLYVRYSEQEVDDGITSLLPPAPGEGYYSAQPTSLEPGAQTNNSQSFELNYDRTISLTLLASVKAGWNYLFWNNSFPAQPLSGVGIPGIGSANPGFASLTVAGPGIDMPVLGITDVPNRDGSENRQLSGDITWTKGQHTLKFGAQVYWLQTNFLSSQSSSGTFTFNGQYTGQAFADFLLGDASAASLSTYAQLNFRVPEQHFFVQDDWKVTRRLTVNLGLRYEITPPAVDVYPSTNEMSNFIMNDRDPYLGTPYLLLAGANGSGLESRALQRVNYHQFAPRLGFAYSLGNKTVIRGGYGIFYSNYITIGGMQSMEKNPPFSVVVSETANKTAPSVFLQNGFPSDALSVANAKNVQLNSWDTRSAPPTDDQWNLNVQRQLSGSVLLEVGYDGNNFDHGWWQIDGNPAPLTADPVGSLNSRRIFTSTAVPGTPYAITLASVKRVQHDGYSRYNAGHIKIEKRYSNGVSFIASYLYSKTMGIGDATGLQNPLDWAAEYAPSVQDMTHHFVGSAIYDLPFGKGKPFGQNWSGITNALFGGWSVDPIVTIDSGLPVNLTEAVDNSNTGQNDRPNIIGNWHLSNPTVNEWFNTAAFALNPPGTFGDAGRNLLRAPGLFNIDLAAHKQFKITERVSAQIRIESFNVTNTPPLGAPNAELGTGSFGTITTAGNPRQIQFGAKVLF